MKSQKTSHKKDCLVPILSVSFLCRYSLFSIIRKQNLSQCQGYLSGIIRGKNGGTDIAIFSRKRIPLKSHGQKYRKQPDNKIIKDVMIIETALTSYFVLFFTNTKAIPPDAYNKTPKKRNNACSGSLFSIEKTKKIKLEVWAFPRKLECINTAYPARKPPTIAML